MEIKHVNTRLLTRSPLAIEVIKVDSPTKFWVHLNTCREDFDELLEDLSRRMDEDGLYTTDFTPDDIKIGEFVAIRDDRS